VQHTSAYVYCPVLNQVSPAMVSFSSTQSVLQPNSTTHLTTTYTTCTDYMKSLPPTGRSKHLYIIYINLLYVVGGVHCWEWHYVKTLPGPRCLGHIVAGIQLCVLDSTNVGSISLATVGASKRLPSDMYLISCMLYGKLYIMCVCHVYDVIKLKWNLFFMCVKSSAALFSIIKNAAAESVVFGGGGRGGQAV